MRLLNTIAAAVGAACIGLAAAPAEAASITLTPSSSTVAPGTVVVLEMRMSFTAAEATLGGSIDIDLQGPISFAGFTPSAWFLSAPDPAFTGHGTANADHEYEVHFGNFAGLSGDNVIGELRVNAVSPGTGLVVLGNTQLLGGFFTASGAPQTVQMSGATITIVPEPSTAMLWLLGAGVMGLKARRRTQA